MTEPIVRHTKGLPYEEDLIASVRALSDLMVELQATILDMPGHVAEAQMQANIRTVKSPEFWVALRTGFRESAVNMGGNWLFGGIGAMFSRIGWLILFGVAIWMIGGPSAIVSAIKAAIASGHTP